MRKDTTRRSGLFDDLCLLRNEEIVHRCNTSATDRLLDRGGDTFGRRVLKITEGLVVKFGLGVSHNEAIAQHIASHLVDQKIVRVTQVYRSFSEI